MTDNVIIKALKKIAKYSGFTDDVSNTLLSALDLINRQQAQLADERAKIEICAETISRQDEEIERLRNENEILSKNADTAFQDGLNEAQDLYDEQIKDEVKAEAIKEFAERLKNIYIKDKRYDRPNAHTLIDWLFNNIDNLVKEMAGDDK